MQSIMELFSLPRDIVMDLIVGSTSTFIVGDYLGHFIIGLENRKEFVDITGRVFLDRMSTKEVQTIAVVSQLAPKKRIEFNLSSILIHNKDVPAPHRTITLYPNLGPKTLYN